MRKNSNKLALLLLTLALSYCIATEKPTEKDRAEIIKLTLERAIVAGEIPGYHLIKDKESIALSPENIDTNLLPRISGIRLLLLNEQQIQERADTEDFFFFLRFRSIQIENRKAEVILENVQAVGKRTREMGFGGGFTIEYQKEDGNWKGKVTSYVIP